MSRSKEYELAIRIAGKVDPSLQKSASKASGIFKSVLGANLATDAIRNSAAALKDFAVGTVQNAVNFESTMSDVAKVVDGLRDKNGNLTSSYYEMSDSILAMSKHIPMAASELGQIMASAGQAGIVNEELVEFTETAAKMGVAFDTTAEQAGDWMAKWRTSFGMSQKAVTSLANQINYLSNNSAANASQISSIVTAVGPLGDVAGIGAAQIAALGSTMVGVGVDQAVAATGIKKMATTMTAGSAATKKQQAVLQQLGFSATSMAARMQTDAQGAILDFMAAVKRLPEVEQAAALKNYFGQESVGAIAPLLTNLDGLQEHFKMVGDAQKYAGSMELEYAARSDTTANSMQLLQNKISAVQTQIGNLLLPAVNAAADTFGGWIGKLGDFVSWASDTQARVAQLTAFTEKHKTALSVAAIAAGAFTTALTLYMVQANAAKIASAAHTTQTWLYCTATDAAAAATAFLASPITMTVGAIAAAVAAGALLYHNWDKLTAKATALAAAINEKFPWMADIVAAAGTIIAGIAGGLKDTFGGLLSFVKSVFAGDWSAAWQGIVDAFGGIWGTITSIAKAPLNAMIGLVNTAISGINALHVDIPDWVPKIGGQTFGFSIPKIPALAAGGIATGPTLAQVGEGVEPEAIMPLSKLQSMLDSISGSNSGGSRGEPPAPVLNITVNVNGNASTGDIQNAAREVAAITEREFERLMAQWQRNRSRVSFAL